MQTQRYFGSRQEIRAIDDPIMIVTRGVSAKVSRLGWGLERALHNGTRRSAAEDFPVVRGNLDEKTQVRKNCVRDALNGTYSISVFDEFSAFYRNQRGLHLNEYEPPQLTRETIVHPAQNRHYSSNTRGNHPRGCPNGVGLTRRQVSVPWGVTSICNSSRYNAQRDKGLSHCRQRARSVGRLGAVALSTRRREFRSSLRLLRSAMTCL